MRELDRLQATSTAICCYSTDLIAILLSLHMACHVRRTTTHPPTVSDIQGSDLPRHLYNLLADESSMRKAMEADILQSERRKQRRATWKANGGRFGSVHPLEVRSGVGEHDELPPRKLTIEMILEQQQLQEQQDAQQQASSQQLLLDSAQVTPAHLRIDPPSFDTPTSAAQNLSSPVSPISAINHSLFQSQSTDTLHAATGSATSAHVLSKSASVPVLSQTVPTGVLPDLLNHSMNDIDEHMDDNDAAADDVFGLTQVAQTIESLPAAPTAKTRAPPPALSINSPAPQAGRLSVPTSPVQLPHIRSPTIAGQLEDDRYVLPSNYDYLPAELLQRGDHSPLPTVTYTSCTSPAHSHMAASPAHRSSIVSKDISPAQDILQREHELFHTSDDERRRAQYAYHQLLAAAPASNIHSPYKEGVLDPLIMDELPADSEAGSIASWDGYEAATRAQWMEAKEAGGEQCERTAPTIAQLSAKVHQRLASLQLTSSTLKKAGNGGLVNKSIVGSAGRKHLKHLSMGEKRKHLGQLLQQTHAAERAVGSRSAMQHETPMPSPDSSPAMTATESVVHVSQYGTLTQAEAASTALVLHNGADSECDSTAPAAAAKRKPKQSTRHQRSATDISVTDCSDNNSTAMVVHQDPTDLGDNSLEAYLPPPSTATIQAATCSAAPAVVRTPATYTQRESHTRPLPTFSKLHLAPSPYHQHGKRRSTEHVPDILVLKTNRNAATTARSPTRGTSELRMLNEAVLEAPIMVINGSTMKLPRAGSPVRPLTTATTITASSAFTTARELLQSSSSSYPASAAHSRPITGSSKRLSIGSATVPTFSRSTSVPALSLDTQAITLSTQRSTKRTLSRQSSQSVLRSDAAKGSRAVTSRDLQCQDEGAATPTLATHHVRFKEDDGADNTADRDVATETAENPLVIQSSAIFSAEQLQALQRDAAQSEVLVSPDAAFRDPFASLSSDPSQPFLSSSALRPSSAVIRPKSVAYRIKPERVHIVTLDSESESKPKANTSGKKKGSKKKRLTKSKSQPHVSAPSLPSADDESSKAITFDDSSSDSSFTLETVTQKPASVSQRPVKAVKSVSIATLPTSTLHIPATVQAVPASLSSYDTLFDTQRTYSANNSRPSTAGVGLTPWLMVNVKTLTPKAQLVPLKQ